LLRPIFVVEDEDDEDEAASAELLSIDAGGVGVAELRRRPRARLGIFMVGCVVRQTEDGATRLQAAETARTSWRWPTDEHDSRFLPPNLGCANPRFAGVTSRPPSSTRRSMSPGNLALYPLSESVEDHKQASTPHARTHEHDT
jgi:hypothetical protein